MTPPPISPHTVHTVLQYISPPSQLVQPLPPFLLSKPLLQRHHFLQISPDDPQQYLSWPSSPHVQAQAIAFLESLPRLHDEPAAYSVQYTADDEHTFAHVNASDGSQGLRLVFQWDEPDGWKYHDVGLMPFPVGSQRTLQDVLATSLGQHKSRVTHAAYVADTRDSEDDDADYWNAYDAHDSASPSPHDFTLHQKDADGTEDAYWARYASVQGTADSTQPSPLPRTRRKPQIASGTASPYPLPVPVRTSSQDDYGEPLPIPPTMIARPITNTKWDPASPRALAHLLTSISPRSSPLPSPAPNSDFTFDPYSQSPLTHEGSGSDDSDTPSPPALVPEHVGQENGRHCAIEPETEALREGVQGMWKLFKAGRGYGSGSDDTKRAFLKVVMDVLENA